MNLNLSNQKLSLRGQRVKHVQHDLAQQTFTIYCDRERRYRVIDPTSGKATTLHGYPPRTSRDLPLCGFACDLEVELAEVVAANGRRMLGTSAFVDTGSRSRYGFADEWWIVSVYEDKHGGLPLK